MKFLHFFLLWFILATAFSLFNNAFIGSEIVIQSINAFHFTVGYYVAYHLLIRNYLYKGIVRKFLLYYVLLAIALTVSSMLLIYQVYIFQDNKFYVKNYWNELVFFTGAFVLLILVISSLCGARILKDKMQTQRKLEAIEKEKISTELNFLKAQINPHFLFNSLNNILFLIDKSNKNARETLLKFSEMLRYQLYDCTEERIEIEREIHYIRNYIEVQMLRRTDRYCCDFKTGSEVSGFSIAPLLLIPLVENAFKYVSNRPGKNNRINLQMKVENNSFHFNVYNDMEKQVTTTVNESKGIGLKNIQRRLELLYPEKHQLSIDEKENSFSVELILYI